MDSTILTTSSDIAACRGAWTALWAAAPDRTPFSTAAWMLAWWQHLGRGRLHAVLVEDHGRLIALGPFYIEGSGYTRVLRLLGAGITDYPDVLVDPDHPDAMDELWRAVTRSRDWDVCELYDLRAGSPLAAHLAERGEPFRVIPGDVCPVLRLASTREAFRGALPSGLRRNLRRYRDRLESRGALQLERATAATLDELLDVFFMLHEGRWQASGLRTGVLASDEVRAFHRDAARALLADGQLYLYGLRCGSALIAVLYTVRTDRRVFSYLGGFDAALAQFSPGSVMLAETIACAIDDGCHEFDFLRGRETYKYTWGATDEVLWNISGPRE